MIAQMKFLIVGCGSIGKRHIRNLKSLGARNFILCDTNKDVLVKAAEGLDNPVLYLSFIDTPKENPDAAVICTPSSMHLSMSLALAKKGVHLLIEKPLSDTLEDIDELERITEEKGTVAMMAMCYRFHPVHLRLKKLLDEKAIGKVYHVNYFGGQYLPDWHPYADYRKEYAAQKKLGGGVVLTTIHGLDDLRWLFGEVVEHRSFVDKVSSLEMDVEDMVMGLFRFSSGVYAVWQTDYLQRSKQHKMVVTGETGTIRCDLVEGVIEAYTASAGKWETEKICFEVNKMYMDEMAHFIECIEKKRRPLADIREGKKTLKLALDVKESGETKVGALKSA